MEVYLFDADGVLVEPHEPFSHSYARRNDIQIELFRRFFREDFPAALVGQADIKDLIARHNGTWQVGTPDEILAEWFAVENIQDEQAVDAVRELRSRGHKCYLATNQEKNRGNYMKTVMFPDLFDGYFISGEMGVKKPDVAFFEQVIAKIQQDTPGVQPQDIVFFDDTPEHVAGAKQAGIDARYYTNIRQITEIL